MGENYNISNLVDQLITRAKMKAVESSLLAGVDAPNLLP